MARPFQWSGEQPLLFWTLLSLNLQGSGSSPGEIWPPREDLVMSGDIFGITAGDLLLASSG